MRDPADRLFKATNIILGAMGLGMILLGATTCVREGRAHSFYEYSCCHDRDCRPVADGAIMEGPNGYVVRATGEVVPYSDKRVRQSPDQNFHWCSIGGKEDSRTLCIYAPGRGF